MMFRAAIALLALVLPAFAQHGGARAGSSGSRGFASHAAFSSHPVFSQPGSFARPAQPARYGPMPGARFRPVSPQNAPGLRTLYNGNRFAAARPSYAATAASQSRSRNRDHFDARRRQFDNWFVNIYPNWPGYPYLLNPNLYNLGLYDWSDSDSFAPDNSAPNNYPYDQGGPSPDYPAPYPDYASAAAAPQPAVAPSTSSAPEQPLTVIFKTGRSPLQVQNYIMTASVFTDLDSGHYEQIPLDQINLAATQLINGAAGIDFQLPRASRD